MQLTTWQPTEEGAKDLLKFLMVVYGQKFTDQWRGLTLGEMKAVWSIALAEFSSEEVQRGLNACMTRVWPPTLPEFLLLCRPPMDYEAAWLEAVQQMRAREEGKDEWSSPAVYWAAVEFGLWEMRHSGFDRAKARWTRILDAQLARDTLPAVPPRMEALPEPGKTIADPEKVRAMIDELKSRIQEPLMERGR